MNKRSTSFLPPKDGDKTKVFFCNFRGLNSMTLGYFLVQLNLVQLKN